jgi:serine protease AprX
MRPGTTSNTGEKRANALWGRGGRRVGAVVATTVSCVLLVASGAAGSPAPASSASSAQAAVVKALSSHQRAYIPGALLSAVQQSPSQSFDVILQGQKREKAASFLQKAFKDSSAGGYAVDAKRVKRQFTSIDGARASLTGWQILTLGTSKNVTAIVSNDSVKTSSVTLPVANDQKWGWSTGAAVDWTGQALSMQTPTIAIVDSGIDTSRTEVFGNRAIGQTSLASVLPNSEGDGYGHGTFVASIAASAAAGHAGVAPSANLLSVDVMGDSGQATVADVVAACDWILANKSQYNIKVANLSLHATNPASLFFDPLDQAVEKLWLNGVTVVTAAGNYAVDGQQSNVPFAPANDPFVITVGAADIMNTLGADDDVAAPWSAWGTTYDGFAKPELSAPGRYMVGATPDNATLALERPDHVVGSGYMQLSGTSFSAPAVAGAAALILTQHPSWTPDQVKGALMVSARGTPAATPGSLGVGELNVPLARMVENPPNPNAGLDQYVSTDADGNPIFDSSAWQTAALADAAWGSAAWSDAAWSDAAWGSAAWGSAAWGSAAWGSAAWSDAAWGDAAWGDAAWSDAAWASAAWGDAAWSDAAWSDAAWSDAAWADASVSDPAVTNSPMTQAEMDQAEADLGIVDPGCDPVVNTCSPLLP